MYGMLRSLAMAAIFSAIEEAWASDSITQGPAIRNKGALAPRRMLATLKVVVGGMCERMVAGTDYAGMGGISTLNCAGGGSRLRSFARSRFVLRGLGLIFRGWTWIFICRRCCRDFWVRRLRWQRGWVWPGKISRAKLSAAW